MYFGEATTQEITDQAVAEVEEAIKAVEDTTINIGEKINTDQFDAFFGIAEEKTEQEEAPEKTQETAEETAEDKAE